MVSLAQDVLPRSLWPIVLSLTLLLVSQHAAAQSQAAAGAPSPPPQPPTSANEQAPAEPSAPVPPVADVADVPDAPAQPETPAAPVPANEEPAPIEPDAAANAVTVAADDAEPELGAVIISARRRNESVQDVPVPVSVLSGNNLEEKGAVNLQSFHKEVPSITSYSGNARNTTINIRGLGTGVSSSGAAGLDSGVGFYVDDVYYGRLSQSILNLIDLDRIEVLRGPQGTLFGRNTTAGAISVITKGPSFTPEATLDLSAGNYRYFQARGAISGPVIGKTLAARISFEAQTRDGFLYSTQLLDSVQRQESFSVRGQALYQPISTLKFRLIVDYSKFAQSCCTQVGIGEATKYDNGTAVAYPFSARVAQFPAYHPLPDDPAARRVDVDRQRFFRVALGGGSLRADWDLGSHTITSISAARAWNTKPRNDQDVTGLDVGRESNDDDRQVQATQELRLTSNGTKLIDHVVGAYFLYQHLPTLQRRDWGPQAGIFSIAPDAMGLSPEQRTAVLDGAFSRAHALTNTLSAALFAQATWHIIDVLDFTGGVRYTFERKSGSYELESGSRTDMSELNEAQLAIRKTIINPIPRYELEKSWNNLGALATLSAKLAADKLIFVTYSRGSKSGGLNFRDLPRDDSGKVQPQLLILKPETVDHFELGIKTQWFDHRLTANLAVYQTSIRDYQNTVVDTSRTQQISYLSNVGEVRSRGVELELRAHPVAGLNLYAGGAYNIAKYLSYKSAQCPWELRAPGEPQVCDLSGQQLPVAPKLSVSAGADYTLRLTDKLDAFAGADVSYRSSYTTNPNNSRYSRVDGVALVNARLGLKSGEGRWQAYIWSQNVLDELYFLLKQVNEQTGRITGLLGDPRTFGGTFRYYFD